MQHTNHSDDRTQDEGLLKGGQVMSLWEHLDELRSRLFKSALVITALFLLAFVYANPILNFLKQPLLHALPDGVNALHFTGPMDIFMANLKVAFMTSILFGCPVWIFQIWKFVEPALYPSERKYVMPFAIASIALFFTGVAFCFWVMVPIALEFFLGMGMEVGIPIITVGDYLSMLSALLIGFGVVFETPVILLLLGALGVIDAKMLSEHRSTIIVIILIIAAVLTPPDVVSQIIMAVPMYIMYEASIVLMRWMQKGREAPAPTSEQRG